MSEGDGLQRQSLDHELNRRIVRSSAWVGVGHGGGMLLTFASTLVLVRLLDPAAFGTVAIGMTLLAVISQIQESGLGAAFVHGRHEHPRVAASSVFVFAACAGLVLTAVTIFVAPFYTALLHLPASTPYVQVLAVILAIRGFAVVPGAILERELDFRSKTQAELSTAVVQAFVAVACALVGMGAWSLVAGLLTGGVAGLAVVWLKTPWRPSPRAASRSAVRELLRYGRFVSGANMMVVVNTNVDNAVVARYLGASQLGVYNLAWRLAELPVTLVSVIVGRVMFSVYSRLQHDLGAVRAAYVQNMQRTMILALPLAVTIGLAAEPIVLGLLGPEWAGAVTPLRVLAVFCLMRLLVAPSGELFKGIGRPHLNLVATTAFFVVALPSLLVLVPRHGATGAALGMIAGISSSVMIMLPLTFAALSLHPAQLARSLARPAACAGVVAGALLLTLPTVDSLEPLAALVLVAVVATTAFVVAVALLGRPLLVPIWASFRRA